MEIEVSRFYENIALSGGAIYEKGKVIMDDSDFYNNSGEWGGAIFSEEYFVI